MFCVSGWLDCNSDGGVMQELSARGAAQILRGNRQGKGGWSPGCLSMMICEGVDSIMQREFL